MGLGDRERQRVVAGVAALGAGEVLRPRLQRATARRRRRSAAPGRRRCCSSARRPGRSSATSSACCCGGREAGSARPVDVGHRRDPDAPQVGLVGVRVERRRTDCSARGSGPVASARGAAQARASSGGGSAEDGTTGRLHDSSTLRQSEANKLRGRGSRTATACPVCGSLSRCRRRTSSAPGPRRPRPRRSRRVGSRGDRGRTAGLELADQRGRVAAGELALRRIQLELGRGCRRCRGCAW